MLREQFRKKLNKVVWVIGAVAAAIAIMMFCLNIALWFPNRFDRLETVIKENFREIRADFDQDRRETENRRTMSEMIAWISRLQNNIEEFERKLEK